MIELVRKNAVLYTKVLMNLRLPIEYKNKKFDTKEKVDLITPDEAMEILTKNGNIKFWNGETYIKLDLGQFYQVMQRKEYCIIDYVEPKKEEVKIQPKVEPKPIEQPKVEVKEEEVIVEEAPKQEQPKKEENKQQNDNKKQRHNNNNNTNKGGGK